MFYVLRNELSVTESPEVVLRGRRIVMPESLRAEVLNIAHAGHQGIVKTKSLLRSKVWFPGMDKKVERLVSSCIPCQSVSARPRREPLRMSEMPSGPWQQLACDFKGPMPNGEYLFVIIDEYSRFPIVEIVRSTSASTIVPKMDKIFGEYGIPEVVKSDNGPPFNGADFKNFAETLGFKHRRITPLWPEANGQIENFMKGLNKIIKISYNHDKPFQQLLQQFLRDYRSTPHSTTWESPFQMLFGRVPRTKIPELCKMPSDDEDVRLQDYRQKEKQKVYADAKRHVEPSTLKVGDKVLIKRNSLCKSDTKFAATPATVSDRHSSMVTATSSGEDAKSVTRNVSQFVKISEVNEENHVDEEAEKMDTEQPKEDACIAKDKGKRTRKAPDRLCYQ